MVELAVGRALDPNASVPLYLQVTTSIAEAISTGRLRPRERLPSERQLCELFNVSRVTARKALARLVEDGLIESSAGRGWFVSGGPVSEPPNVLQSFSDMGQSRGLQPSAKVLHAQVRPASLDEAEILQVAPGADLFDLRRRRCLDQLPIGVDRSVLPLSLAPTLVDVDFRSASLYRELQLRGVVPTHADFAVEASIADAQIGRLLDVGPGTALLEARQRTYDQRGERIEIGHTIYRADRYRFRARLSALSSGNAK